ncbi:MAG: hypothetical protein R3C59_27390 [Planctomycetaceae bacterium]
MRNYPDVTGPFKKLRLALTIGQILAAHAGRWRSSYRSVRSDVQSSGLGSVVPFDDESSGMWAVPVRGCAMTPPFKDA